MKGIGNSPLLVVTVTAAIFSSFGNGGIVVVNAFNSFFAAPIKVPSKNAASHPTTIPPPPPSRIDTESWLDVLAYDKNDDTSTPPFDVLAKTIEYANCKNYDTLTSYYSDDYVFRGPIIGPITAEDVRKTQEVRLFFSLKLSIHCLMIYVLMPFFPCSKITNKTK